MLALREGHVAADGPVMELLRPDRLSDLYAAPLQVAQLGPGQTAVIPAFPADREASD